MTIVFVSAGLYHHISEMTDALYEEYGNDFHFFALDSFVPESIETMGHEMEMRKRPYYRNINDTEEVAQEAKFWCLHADVGIIGCGHCEEYLHLRMTTNLLTFKMKERLFKKGLTQKGISHYEREIREDILPYLEKNLYYLCMGHFSAHDLYRLGVPKEKLLKWGYFVYPSCSPKLYSVDDGVLKLCWGGRFIPQKRPELALQILERLKSYGIKTSLTYLGYGPLEEVLKQQVAEKQMQEDVFFLGKMPEWQVREQMRRADWFLFTSTGWEGWGVVLSEAMSEGVACLATKAAGSSMELIKNGVNGILVGESESLEEEACAILMRYSFLERSRMGEQAYHTLETKWSKTALTESLLSLLRNYEISGNVLLQKEGLCSMAPIEPYEEYEDTFSIENRLWEFGVNPIIP